MRTRVNNLPARNRILAFIIRYKKDNDGIAPTVHEIQEGAEIKSTSSVNYHMLILQKMGKIKIAAKSPRAIRVVGGHWVPPSA